MAYHPQRNGMVEWFNHSLLQLLQGCVDTQNDWERHLLLVLYAYQTAVHASTCLYLEYNHNSQTRFPTQDLIQAHIRLTFKKNLHHFLILWNLRQHKQHSGRKPHMIFGQPHEFSMSMTLFGYHNRMLENWIPGGKGNGV